MLTHHLFTPDFPLTTHPLLKCPIRAQGVEMSMGGGDEKIQGGGKHH